MVMTIHIIVEDWGVWWLDRHVVLIVELFNYCSVGDILV